MLIIIIFIMFIKIIHQIMVLNRQKCYFFSFSKKLIYLFFCFCCLLGLIMDENLNRQFRDKFSFFPRVDPSNHLIYNPNMSANTPRHEYSNVSHQLIKSNEYQSSITNFGKCKICNDKATGIHYGVASCEGCKVRFVFIQV